LIARKPRDPITIFDSDEGSPFMNPGREASVVRTQIESTVKNQTM
jgi:hypothetical protein